MIQNKCNVVAVVGIGTMGTAIAADLAMHGVKVIAIDVEKSTLANAEKAIPQLVRTAMLLNKSLPRVRSSDVLDLITFTTNLDDARSCNYLVENITEDIAAKRSVYQSLDQICESNVCFAVNTSCVSITEIGSYTNRPEQVIGVHLMNPVYLKKCAEVIRGARTSEKTIDQTSKFLASIGKQCVIVNDFPGFVSNRISHLFMNEAVFVVQDQVAEPKSVDEIFKRCYGHKMGPLETADLIGLDTVANSLNVLYESYGDPKFRCAPLLKKMVHAGLLGRKSGEGFYKYTS